MKLLVAVVLLTLASVSWITQDQWRWWGHPRPPAIQGVLLPSPAALDNFVLRDHEQRAFTHRQLAGRWHLLAYGFTQCPEFCPTLLKQLAEMMDLFEADIDDKSLQVLFYSVDPERDASDQLKRYVNYFHPTFIGLRRDESSSFLSFEKSLGIVYKVDSQDPQLGYSVNHGTLLYLINPQGKLQAIFKPSENPSGELIFVADKLFSDFISVRNYTKAVDTG